MLFITFKFKYCCKRNKENGLALNSVVKANLHQASSGVSSVKVPLECIAKCQGERHNVTMVPMGPCRLTRRLTLGVFTPLDQISFNLIDFSVGYTKVPSLM